MGVCSASLAFVFPLPRTGLTKHPGLGNGSELLSNRDNTRLDWLSSVSVVTGLTKHPGLGNGSGLLSNRDNTRLDWLSSVSVLRS